ncbi:MAG TPA: amino acid adenylation domain-containing protein, partial [Verrucomicrobiae bacterium]|nr:amino acid adenylation domain-containing protein [Verrucomicrobiae bacterium]
GSQPVSTIPPQRPRPAVPSYRGSVVWVELDTELSEGLRRFAAARSASAFMVLLAALDVLLYRYSRQEEIIVGTPHAGRSLPQSEGLIGLFLNMLPIRAEVGDDPTFTEILDRVKRKALDAFANEHTPFEQMVEALKLPRDLSVHPLFQVMFAYQNFPVPALNLPGLHLDLVQFDRGISQFDLSLTMFKEGGRLRGGLEYSTDLYDRETIERLAGHYVQLLRGIVAAPQTRISALKILEPDERKELLEKANATSRDYPRERTVVEMIEEQAERRSGAVAVSFEGRSLTYGQLEERSRRLARHLQGLGVGAGSLVGLCLERGLEMVVGVLGVLKSGAAYVPLDPGFPAERLSYMLSDSGARVLVSQEELGQRLFGEAGGVERVYVDRDAELIGAQSAEALVGQAGAADRAYVLYTSGSTGRPKGVEIEHGGLTNFLCSMRHEPGMEERDVLVAVTTLSFDIAGLELFLPLICGARIELASRQTALDGVALGRLLRQSGATVMQATPATWRMLFESGWSGQSQLKVLCGGEAMGRDLAGRLVGSCASVWNLYGPTETTIWSTVGRVESEAVDIGRPIANTRVYILDKNREPVPRGVVGELWIGGAGVARGYLNQPKLTAERFVEDPFDGGRMYQTGDLGRYLADGRLECLGRVDQQVKIRGYRIELGEIESILGEHEQVRECAVVAREVGGEKRLVAYVAGEAEQVESWREHLRGRLPEYMVPSVFVPLEALPHTPNNKIDRKALPEPAGVPAAKPTVHLPPETETEKVVAHIFETVLASQDVGLTHDFFD